MLKKFAPMFFSLLQVSIQFCLFSPSLEFDSYYFLATVFFSSSFLTSPPKSSIDSERDASSFISCLILWPLPLFFPSHLSLNVRAAFFRDFTSNGCRHCISNALSGLWVVVSSGRNFMSGQQDIFKQLWTMKPAVEKLKYIHLDFSFYPTWKYFVQKMHYVLLGFLCSCILVTRIKFSRVEVKNACFLKLYRDGAKQTCWGTYF